MTLKQFKDYMRINKGNAFSCKMFELDSNGEAHQLWDAGLRRLVLVNTVDFGFETDKGTVSHCSWPKAKNLITIIDPNSDTPIFRVDLPEMKRYLVYRVQL